MLLLFAAAASALSAPEPKKPGSWWSYDDVPTQMLQDEVTYIVGYSLVVDPQGKIRECRIESTSGLPQLDKYTCKLATRRARLDPATNAAGEPVFGAYRQYASFWMGDTFPKPREDWGDLKVTVAAARIPDGKTKHVWLALSVDAVGIPTDCVPTKREKEFQLAQDVCPAAMANLRLPPVLDDKGTYVPSVQNVAISVSPR
jgi:hypothetical protein